MRSLELALDLGALVIENGGPTPAADRAFASVVDSRGVAGAFVIWRLDTAIAGTTAADRSCLIRPVRHARVNLRRVAEISALAERARAGGIGEDALEMEIERIERLAPPYGRPTMLALTACVTGAFSLSQGGDWSSFVITAGAATAGQVLGAWLQPLKPSAGFATFVSAIVSATIAAVVIHMRMPSVPPAALTGAVIHLIPGLPLINGFFDFGADAHFAIGVQRIVSAVFLCALLAIAVAIAVVVTG